jgi:hypothetical protein
MSTRHGLALLSLICIPARLIAEDLVLGDWRLQGGLISTSYGAPAPQVSNGTGPSSSVIARNAISNHRVELQYQGGRMGAWGGPIYGAAVWYGQAKFVDSDHEDDLNTAGIDLDVGYGLALSSAWHVEATVMAGAGRSQTEVFGSSDEERTRPAYEGGARIGAYWTGESGFQLGIAVPYLYNDTHSSYSYVGGDGTLDHVDEKRINRGFGVLVSAGLRW